MVSGDRLPDLADEHHREAEDHRLLLLTLHQTQQSLGILRARKLTNP